MRPPIAPTRATPHAGATLIASAFRRTGSGSSMSAGSASRGRIERAERRRVDVDAHRRRARRQRERLPVVREDREQRLKRVDPASAPPARNVEVDARARHQLPGLAIDQHDLDVIGRVPGTGSSTGFPSFQSQIGSGPSTIRPTR